VISASISGSSAAPRKPRLFFSQRGGGQPAARGILEPCSDVREVLGLADIVTGDGIDAEPDRTGFGARMAP